MSIDSLVEKPTHLYFLVLCCFDSLSVVYDAHTGTHTQMRHVRSKAPLLPAVTEVSSLIEGNSSRPASPTTRIASLQENHERCREELFRAIEDKKNGLIKTPEKMRRMEVCRKELARLADRRREVERDLKDVGLDHLYPIERSDEVVKRIAGVSGSFPHFSPLFCYFGPSFSDHGE
jgi:hypothetical protein